ncbi:MAG TPA: gliding motility-associated C-terminal domain-containing protein [Bacteroidia bacterium]|nr:gliding motility-associated C-terminal domain-containing protein [Bacteroidia bacterium]
MNSTKQKHFPFLVTTIIIFICSAKIVNAQFWTEDFSVTNVVASGEANGYVGSNPGAWSVTTLPGNNVGGFPNIWYISCLEASMQPNNCGDDCPPVPLPPPTPYVAQSLHIGTGLIGDNGALYLETGGFMTDTELRVESPTINCTGQTNIILSFNYIEFGDGTNDNAQVWYFNGVTWSLLADMPKTLCGDGQGGPCNTLVCDGASQGYWTAFSVALPASADNNPNVKIGFYWQNIDDGIATDPSIAIGSISLTSPVSANTITAGNLVGPFCACSTANLPFSSNGTFTSSNDYTVQLSDATGSFAAPVNIGTLTSTANIGSIPLTFPCNTPTGSGYMIQIVSSAPVATSTAIGPFTINAPAPLSVTVTANPGTAICAGQCVTFNTTVTNGGTAPTYQWQVNGANAPGISTEDSLVICSLQNGDAVTVIVTSNLTCVSNSPATSTAQNITFVAAPPLSASLTTVPSPFIICTGDPITLTASTVNGGTTPTFAWTVNDNLIPTATSSVLNYTGTPIPINDGTEICVIATSSLSCASNSPDTVCAIVTVLSASSPTVTISADTTEICVGGTASFSSSITNGGTAPTYQWLINGVAAPGGNSSTFTTGSLVQGDLVSLQITSNSTCASSPIATSNTVSINILPFETPSVSILPNAAICPGQLVTFISNQTGGGTSPIFQWYINDTLYSTSGSNLSVNAAVFQENDTLSCIMYSNYMCLLVDSAISNDYVIHILPAADVDLGPDVSIFFGESYKTDPEINGPANLGTYLWSPDSTLSCNTCLNPIANPTITTDFVMNYKNTAGCIARDTIKIEVKPNYEVFIPSGFSPNNDNINDVFYARGPYIKSVNMKIWDRYGAVIFESPYSNYGWDGTNRFKDINTGVYVYYITVVFLDGVTKEFKGNITLSR